jgi:hypothetical protein
MDLPNEIIWMIFKYIPPKDLLLNCSMVSYLWNNLSNDDFLWKGFLPQKYKVLSYKNKMVGYKKIYKYINYQGKNKKVEFIKTIHIGAKFTICGYTDMKKYSHCNSLYRSTRAEIFFLSKITLYIEHNNNFYIIPDHMDSIIVLHKKGKLCYYYGNIDPPNCKELNVVST